MAKKNDAAATPAETTSNANKYNQRRWFVPSKRAKGYADERKEKVHMRGPKQGQELDEYQKGLRSGYLMCQNDHAGLYKYKKARSEGKSKAEAAAISRQKKNAA